jgi:hypothetical protein
VCELLTADAPKGEFHMVYGADVVGPENRDPSCPESDRELELLRGRSSQITPVDGPRGEERAGNGKVPACHDGRRLELDPSGCIVMVEDRTKRGVAARWVDAVPENDGAGTTSVSSGVVRQEGGGRFDIVIDEQNEATLALPEAAVSGGSRAAVLLPKDPGWRRQCRQERSECPAGWDRRSVVDDEDLESVEPFSMARGDAGHRLLQGPLPAVCWNHHAHIDHQLGLRGPTQYP